MSTSILSTGNPQFLFQNQTLGEMIYNPALSFGLDYLYSTQMDKISSSNSMQLAGYGAITSLATKVINDNVLLNLTTNNNFYIISQNWTQKLMGPILNGFLYLYMTKQFKSNLPYYNHSDIQTFVKAAVTYFLADNASDLLISYMTTGTY